jgi:RNA polymerase sigma factor (sigma-70 family)
MFAAETMSRPFAKFVVPENLAERNKLIVENVGLAKKLTSKCHATKKYHEYDDLLQVAYVGLIKAADGYTPSSGAKFSTYAYKIIERRLTNYVMRDSYLAKMYASQIKVLSVDAPVASSSSAEPSLLIDLLSDDSSTVNWDKIHLVDLLEKMRPDQREVVEAHFFEDKSIEAIAKETGVWPATLRKRFKNALQVLKGLAS